MLAVGLSIAACQAGYSVYFTTLYDMVRNLREAESAGRFAKTLQTYLKPAALVCDKVLASAILDRLLHHAEVISINGPSYRLKDHMLEQREGGDCRLQS